MTSNPTNQTLTLDEIKTSVTLYIECWKQSYGKAQRETGISNPQETLIAEPYGLCEDQYLTFIKLENGQPRWKNKIEDLPYDIVIQLPIVLSRQLEANAQSLDHRVLWSWIGELVALLLGGKNKRILDDFDFSSIFHLLIRINLFSIGNTRFNGSSRIQYDLIEILIHKFQLSFTLSFPALERLLKLKCKEYVDLDGNVLKPIPNYNKSKVSSIKVLLNLLECTVANPTLQNLLQSFRSVVSPIIKSSDVWDQIFDWRNNTSHGASSWSLGNAVILNLICLILLDSLKDDYDFLITEFRNKIRSGVRIPQADFYPPECI